MESSETPILGISETGADGRKNNLGMSEFSRRSFLIAGTVAVATGRKKFVFVQNPDQHQPTATDGPPPCDGECKIYPYILIPSGPNDRGDRSTDVNDHSLGDPSQNVWLEDIETGRITDTPLDGHDYQIVVRVANHGSAPTYNLSVDFLIWTSVNKINNTNVYSVVSSKHGLALMQNDTVIVKSVRWNPMLGKALKTGKTGDIIIRAYDPWADHYTETGIFLYVKRDRHLAHQSYKRDS